MTEPMRPLLFWSLGGSILLHLLCAVLIWKVHVPAYGLQDSTPLMIRVLRSGEIPKFIDQPDAAKATKPVRSKDISQVTSEARGRGRIQGPGSTAERAKTRKGGEAPAIPSAQEPLEKSLPSLREQIASLGELGLSGGEEVRGETGTDERTISLETRSSEFAPYLAEVKRRIVRRWDYPPYARQVGLGGDVVLVFSITREGNLVGVRITKSSGVSVLDEAAVKAVRAGAPYARFGTQFTFRQLNIVASFRYITRDAPSR
ncbi:MAG: TonB family protein [Candidatus Methylomirabilales bacterium]